MTKRSSQDFEEEERRSPPSRRKERRINDVESDIHQQLATLNVKFEKECEMCDDKHEATLQCLDCGVVMCSEISNYHLKLKVNRNHRVVPLEEAKEYLESHPLPVVVMCPDHPDKPYEYFDETCQKLLCVSCAILGNHSGHECSSIPEAARNCREDYDRIIQDLGDRVKVLSNEEDSVRNILQEFHHLYEERSRSLDETFSSLIEEIKARHSTLSSKLCMMYQEKKEMLNSHCDTQLQLKRLIEKLQDRFYRSSEQDDTTLIVDLLVLHNEYDDIVEQSISLSEKCLQIIPTVRPYLELILPSYEPWNIRQYGQISDQVLSESLSILQSDPSATILHGEKISFTLRILDREGTPYEYCSPYKPRVTLKLRDSLTGKQKKISLECDERPERGEFSLHYLVPFFDHRLHVYLNEIEVSGSPKVIKLTSVSNKLRCEFCHSPAARAHACSGKWKGLCEKHLECLHTSKCQGWNPTPQKCNEKSK